MGLPPVVKNLIMLNVLMLLATWVIQNTTGLDLSTKLGLYFPASERFMPLQIVTHMFMHGGFLHLLLNMYALYVRKHT